MALNGAQANVVSDVQDASDRSTDEPPCNSFRQMRMTPPDTSNNSAEKSSYCFPNPVWGAPGHSEDAPWGANRGPWEHGINQILNEEGSDDEHIENNSRWGAVGSAMQQSTGEMAGVNTRLPNMIQMNGRPVHLGPMGQMKMSDMKVSYQQLLRHQAMSPAMQLVPPQLQFIPQSGPQFFRPNGVPTVLRQIDANCIPRNGMQNLVAIRPSQPMPKFQLVAPAVMSQGRSLNNRPSSVFVDLNSKLDVCFKQLSLLQQDRFHFESALTQLTDSDFTTEGKVTIVAKSSNASRLERLLIEMMKEHSRITWLVSRVSQRWQVSSAVSEKLEDWTQAVKKLQLKQPSSNLENPGKFVQDNDITSLANAVISLYESTRHVRTSLQLTKDIVQSATASSLNGFPDATPLHLIQSPAAGQFWNGLLHVGSTRRGFMI